MPGLTGHLFYYDVVVEMPGQAGDDVVIEMPGQAGHDGGSRS